MANGVRDSWVTRLLNEGAIAGSTLQKKPSEQPTPEPAQPTDPFSTLFRGIGKGIQTVAEPAGRAIQTVAEPVGHTLGDGVSELQRAPEMWAAWQATGGPRSDITFEEHLQNLDRYKMSQAERMFPAATARRKAEIEQQRKLREDNIRKLLPGVLEARDYFQHRGTRSALIGADQEIERSPSELKKKQFKDLTKEQRRLVQWNTVLTQAVQEDTQRQKQYRRHFKKDDAAREEYTKLLQKRLPGAAFRKDKAPYMPATLALLDRMDFTDSFATQEDFLNLDMAASMADIEALESDYRPSPLRPEPEQEANSLIQRPPAHMGGDRYTSPKEAILSRVASLSHSLWQDVRLDPETVAGTRADTLLAGTIGVRGDMGLPEPDQSTPGFNYSAESDYYRKMYDAIVSGEGSIEAGLQGFDIAARDLNAENDLNLNREDLFTFILTQAEGRHRRGLPLLDDLGASPNQLTYEGLLVGLGIEPTRRDLRVFRRSEGGEGDGER